MPYTRKTLTIGDSTRNGLYQITDTNLHGDILQVTVRELIGEHRLPVERLEAMRRLARRAVERPETIVSARTVNQCFWQGSWHVTFAIVRVTI
jgi:hypothetical protein